MEPERHCTKCGQVIPWGQTECPLCSGHRGYLWSLGRETFLLVIVACLILLFVITGFTVNSYHAMERALAQDWYIQGEAEVRAGHAEAALADFRNALSYAPDNSRYQLELALALEAAGRSQEARTYLLNLWEREPGNGTVNLELARVAAREHAVSDALRYFQGAIYGEWDGDPVLRRRAARLELVEFLLNYGEKATARAELIGLAADLPADAKLQAKVGALLMKVGGYDDALKLFRLALTREPRLAPALAGAGECYFQTGQYAQALRYLDRAIQQDPHLPAAVAMHDTARAVLDLDPFARRLDNTERARRAAQAFEQAMTRLQACAVQSGIDLHVAGATPLQMLSAEATELQPRLKQRSLSRDSELLSTAMDLVFEIEKATSKACGEPQGSDLALLLIAQQQEGARP